MEVLSNDQIKEVAKRFYLSISENEIIGVRMSKKYKGSVELKVYNARAKEEGIMTVGVNLEHNEILLVSEIGVHASGTFTDFLQKRFKHIVEYRTEDELVKKDCLGTHTDKEKILNKIRGRKIFGANGFIFIDGKFISKSIRDKSTYLVEYIEEI